MKRVWRAYNLVFKRAKICAVQNIMKRRYGASQKFHNNVYTYKKSELIVQGRTQGVTFMTFKVTPEISDYVIKYA